ncbi:zinc-dependent metalloprotease [Catenulispora yoronensis]|uniref:Zinc-dependent metalloprotease n=1 Tax=Catenulispora yoronensis TaxID=450799 RepID=A0ABN2U5N2_9ACTN
MQNTTRPAGIDYDLAHATAARHRNPGLENTTDTRLAQLAVDLPKMAATARGAAADWIGMPLPAEQDCRIEITDYLGILQAQIDTLKSLIPRQARTSRWRSTLYGKAMAVPANRMTALFNDLNPNEMPYLLINAPRLMRRAVQAEAHKLTVDHLAMAICLHEETHRLQYLRWPWIASLRQRLVVDLDEARSARNRQWIKALRGQDLALRALIEGHATVAEYDAMPELPVEQLRAFADHPGPLRDRVAQAPLRRILRHYHDGEAFVRSAAATLGWATFNELAWAGPENLPALGEIRDPQRWCRRIAA